MGEKNFKVNVPIEVGYQAQNAQSGLVDVVAEVFLPSKIKDLVNFPDVPLVEVADTGTYRGQFIPNVEGIWQVIIHRAGNVGKVTKSFSVGNHNVHTIGESVGAINTAVGVVSDMVDDISSSVDVIDGKVDTVNSKIDSLSIIQVTPPMAF